ncbi:MAG: rRNA pseudouridine synthase [Gammaproteobacteria bacterium]|nr:rRNA pseudouridine synthase [Gammaproteobacteria bacterium]
MQSWSLRTLARAMARRERSKSGGRAPSGRSGRAAEAPEAGERVQKALAQAGIASRREAEGWIRAGRVTVNGTVAELGSRVIGRDELRVDGRVVRRSRDASRLGKETTVFLCHRSTGESLTQGLYTRLPRRVGRRFLAVSPMPRVDGGLEIITTDGALAERLQRRVRRWPTEFIVRVRGELNAARLESLSRGELDGGRTVAVSSVEGSATEPEGLNRWYRIIAIGASGKDIRQLFERQGAMVSRVQRTSLGPLTLTRDLARGQFRTLTAEEAQYLEAAPERLTERLGPDL